MAETANGSDINWSMFFEELEKGQALTEELQGHLGDATATPVDQLRTVVRGVHASFEKLRSMAKTLDAQPPFLHSTCDHSPKKSTRSSGKKRDVNLPFRKTMARHTTQVQVPTSSPESLEVADSYSWRKYGQKNIHGNRHPRGYYRCSHRFKEGCEALKTMQRSEEDPMTVEVTYKGKHTCRASQEQGLLLQSLKAELRVKTEDLGDSHTFSPTPQIAHVNSCQVTPSSSSTGVFQTLSMTPEAVGFGESGAENHWCEREFEEILSAANSVTASPTESFLDVWYKESNFDV